MVSVQRASSLSLSNCYNKAQRVFTLWKRTPRARYIYTTRAAAATTTLEFSSAAGRLFCQAYRVVTNVDACPDGRCRRGVKINAFAGDKSTPRRSSTTAMSYRYLQVRVVVVVVVVVVLQRAPRGAYIWTNMTDAPSSRRQRPTIDVGQPPMHCRRRS